MEAVQLYREEVYPDMVGRHLVGRAERNTAAAAPYNAAAAAKADKSFREVFGPEGSKLDARCCQTSSIPKWAISQFNYVGWLQMSCFHTRNGCCPAAYHMPAPIVKPSNTREFLRGLGHQGRQEGAKAIGNLCNGHFGTMPRSGMRFVCAGLLTGRRAR